MDRVGLAALAAFVAVSPAAAEPRTLSDLGYAAATLSESSPQSEYWVELPGNWLLETGSTAEFLYTHPAGDTSHAALRATLNGQEIGRLPLGSDAVALGRWVVDLPVIRPTPDGLHLVVEFLSRGDTTECVAPDERAVVIREISAVNVEHSLRPVDEELSALPYPLVWERADAPIEVTFVIPSDPSAEELDAAARAAAWLGRQAGSSAIDLHALWDADASPDNLKGSVLVLATDRMERGALPQILRRCGEGATQASLTLCQLGESEHRGVLWAHLPASELEEALDAWLEGAQLRGRRSVIRPAREPAPQPWRDKRTEFAQLGVTELMVRGLGESERTLYFPRPRGWQLSNTSSLTLHITHSADSDLAIEVSINGTSAGSIGPEGLQNERFQVPLPSVANRTPAGRPADYLIVGLKITQRIEDALADCDPRAEEAWTLIHGDSYFDIHPAEPSLPDLFWFPFPFSRPDATRPTQIRIAEFQGEELAAALSLAAEIGRHALAPPPLSILAADAPDEDAHVALMGVAAWDAWTGLLAEPVAVEIERPAVPTSAEFEESVGQIVAFAVGQRQGLFLEADAGHATRTVRALHAHAPSGTRILVGEDGAMTVEATSSGVLRSLLELPGKVQLGLLHWILIATNLIALLMLWITHRRVVSLRREARG
ncbi:MAG: cellulose biosynthesis cyclic di-GMP-binding regulatory protein BcsB [Myxococcota bacterium]